MENSCSTEVLYTGLVVMGGGLVGTLIGYLIVRWEEMQRIMQIQDNMIERRDDALRTLRRWTRR